MFLVLMEFEETAMLVQQVIWYVKTVNLAIVLVDQKHSMDLLGLLKIFWKNLNGITAAILNMAVKICLELKI